MTVKRLELKGQTFGRWTVIDIADRDKYGRWCWHCRCICGKEKILPGTTLKQGISRSCGCLAADIQRERITKYPEWPTRTGAASHVVEKNGKKQTLKEWSKELGIPLPVLVIRWNRGWEDHEILRPTRSQIIEKHKIPDGFSPTPDRGGKDDYWEDEGDDDDEKDGEEE